MINDILEICFITVIAIIIAEVLVAIRDHRK